MLLRRPNRLTRRATLLFLLVGLAMPALANESDESGYDRHDANDPSRYGDPSDEMPISSVQLVENCLSCNRPLEPTEDLELAAAASHVVALAEPIYIPPALRGDLRCRAGDDDCNVCAPTVEAQFRRAAANAGRREERSWRFEEWSQPYWPGRPSTVFRSTPVTPYETLDPDTGTWEWLGVPSGHIQGFVRTNNPDHPYAGSHSNKGDDHFGSVFVISADGRDDFELTALHTTVDHHPSGVQILGNYVIFGDEEGLRLVDLGHPHTFQPERLRLPAPSVEPKHQFGGGIAMARLGRESYLLLSSTPGGRKNETKYQRLFHVRGDLSNPTALSIRAIGEPVYDNPSHWPEGFAHNENASMVTECETGSLYVIHTSGQGADDGLGGLEGNGFWRLSRLERDASWMPRIRPRMAFQMSQDTATCHLRSAGTVTVLQDGTMEFNCHQYFEDPDPSVASPFGDFSHDYRFKRWDAR